MKGREGGSFVYTHSWVHVGEEPAQQNGGRAIKCPKQKISLFEFSTNKPLLYTLKVPRAVSLPRSEVAMLWGTSTGMFPLFEGRRVWASEGGGKTEKKTH